MTRRTLTMLALTTLMPLAAEHHAMAAFSQATCSSSTWDTAIPTKIGPEEYVKKSENPPGGTADMIRYNVANLTPDHAVLMNSNIQWLQPYYGYFVTELNYDKLHVYPSAGVNFDYHGTLNASTTTVVNSTHSWNVGTAFIGSPAFSYQWYSDLSVSTNIPPTLVQVTPQCKTSQTTSAGNNTTLSLSTRYEVILIKGGDTHYSRFVQPAFTPVVLSMDLLNATSGADFDLYASTSTTQPDDSSFQWRGFSSSASEALLIPASSASRTIYVGVHSYTGAGHVALEAATTMQISTSLCVADSTLTNQVTLTPAQIVSLKQFLAAGAAHLFGYSNGILFRSYYSLNTTWTGQCQTTDGCDICIVADSGAVSYGFPVSGYSCGHVEMHGGNWGLGAPMGWLFAHESGHACFNLPDEYKTPPAGDSSPGYCGHSTMANHSRANAFCSKNHCMDGHVFDIAQCDPTSANNWKAVQSSSFAYHYTGPLFGNSVSGITWTAFPTRYWLNPNFLALVTYGF